MQNYYFEDLSASAENINTINKMIYQRWWHEDYDFQTVETYLQQQIYQAKNGKVRLLFDQDQQFLGFFAFLILILKTMNRCLLAILCLC